MECQIGRIALRGENQANETIEGGEVRLEARGAHLLLVEDFLARLHHVLDRADATVVHDDPNFVALDLRAVVGDDIGVLELFQHLMV